jgi:hypothetical protein
MSFSKITRRTVFSTHLITRQVQCLQSLKSDLFHLPFSRFLRTLKPSQDLYLQSKIKMHYISQENELLKNKLKALQKEAELPRKNWCSL